MWHAADIAEKARHAVSYQFNTEGKPVFNWGEFKVKRDAYIFPLFFQIGLE